MLKNTSFVLSFPLPSFTTGNAYAALRDLASAIRAKLTPLTDLERSIIAARDTAHHILLNMQLPSELQQSMASLDDVLTMMALHEVYSEMFLSQLVADATPEADDDDDCDDDEPEVCQTCNGHEEVITGRYWNGDERLAPCPDCVGDGGRADYLYDSWKDGHLR